MMLKPRNKGRRKRRKKQTKAMVYRNNVKVMESLDCISRFETKVAVLKNAAEAFQKLGEFKDAAELAVKCEEMSQKAVKNGTARVYKQALTKYENAITKSDYVDAIEAFNRVKSFGYNFQSCEEYIKKCEDGILNIETKKFNKRKVKLLGILALIAAAFFISPFFPMIKGMINQSNGDYSKAIANYSAAHGIIGTKGKLKECYYAVADEALKNGELEKALDNYKLAGDKADAPVMKRRLEQLLINRADIGDTVDFGQASWIVLDKVGDEVLLVNEFINKQKEFDKQNDTDWKLSSLRIWLNNEYRMKFSAEERDIIINKSTKSSLKNVKEKIFLLSEEQYTEYKALIPLVDNAYWLKDAAKTANNVKAVQADGSITEMKADNSEVYVRQAMWVNSNIEDADKARIIKSKEKSSDATPYPTMPAAISS